MITANGPSIRPAAIITAWFVPHGFTRPSGSAKPSGQHVQLLVDVVHLDAAAEAPGREDLAELALEGVAYDEYHLAEAGAHGVVDRNSR